MFGLLKDKLTGGAARLNGKADLLEGICAACVLVGAADGDLSDDEGATALDRLMNHETLSKAFSGTQIETAFDKQAKRAKSGMSGRLALRREVEDVKAKSSSEDCEMLLVIAIDVAYADGNAGDKEKAALRTIAQAMGLSLDRYIA
jgi:tellurite resistance protein TerB